MKKAVSLIMSLLMVLPFAFADISKGDRITTYDDGSQLVGEGGYIDISLTNTPADVFVCGTKEGRIVSYGMNLNSDAQIRLGTSLVEQLAEMSFAGFDHYGCLWAKI